MATTETSLPFVDRLLGIRPQRRRQPYPWLDRGVYWGGLVPLAYMALRATQGELGANPISQVLNELGMTALIFLVATLACTPARRLLGWTWQMRIRRQLGLFTFTYALLHFLTYVFVDQLLDLPVIFADIVERPFISVGFLALVLMAPMAITSTNDWVRRLGYRRWAQIHYAIYPVAALAVLHFIWRVKIDLTQPIIYGVIVAGLLGVRVVFWLRTRARKRQKVKV